MPVKPGDPERAGSVALYSSGQWARATREGQIFINAPVDVVIVKDRGDRVP